MRDVPPTELYVFQMENSMVVPRLVDLLLPFDKSIGNSKYDVYSLFDSEYSIYHTHVMPKP